MTKLGFKMAGVMLLISCFSMVLTGCDMREEAGAHTDSKNPVLIQTADVLEKKMSLPIHAGGILAPKKTVRLSFKTGGIIAKILVDEGQAVKKGQLMAELDLSEIRSRVSQMESVFKKARRDLERTRSLFQDNVATLEQVQDATTSYEVARSYLDVARFNQKHSRIYAPAEGKILKRIMETNELVDAGMPVLVFGSSEDEWVVRVGVTDQDVVKLQLGDSAAASFDAYPGETFPARVSEIAETATPTSGTFEVELQIDAGGVKMVSGFVASMKIFPQKTQTCKIIPIEALVEADKRGGFVYIPLPDKDLAKKIPIKIRYIMGDQIAVARGLENVETVITDGSAYLSDGAAIQKADLTNWAMLEKLKEGFKHQ